MDLFTSIPQEVSNLLPHDGTVTYQAGFLPGAEATNYFDTLLSTLAWKPDEAILYGKKIITRRKVGWYGDRDFSYTYSNTTKKALPWTPELLHLKSQVEKASGEQFNSCLLNLYHSGEEGMGWHSDAEKELKKDGAIASVSLGAARKFCFRHKKSAETICLVLEHGSLLIMKGTTQSNWVHRLPPSKRILTSRINLTFRMIAHP